MNREMRLLLADWNLGTITSDVTQTARECLLAKLKQPTPSIRERLMTVLQLDELFGEEFISDRQVLRELIAVMLTSSDWSRIATVAADSVKMQIMGYADSKVILNKCL